MGTTWKEGLSHWCLSGLGMSQWDIEAGFGGEGRCKSVVILPTSLVRVACGFLGNGRSVMSDF